MEKSGEPYAWMYECDFSRERTLSDQEEYRLREVIASKCPHYLPEFDVSLNTGMRLSEQYGLTWNNVPFERRIITISRSKNSQARYIPLNDATFAALRTAHDLSNGKPRVFLNCYGEQLMRPRKWFEAAIKQVGIQDFSWHCLRHTFASRLVMASVDLRTVQELMGHKTIQITVRYAHLAPKHQLAAVQRLCSSETAQARPTDTKTDTVGFSCKTT